MAVAIGGLWACQDHGAPAASDTTGPVDVPVRVVSDEPLSLGTGVEIGPDSVFFDSVTRGTFLPDGDILVSLRGGERRLLLLDSAGGFKKVVGREGQGPGEFRRIIQVSLNGETASIWDREQYRASLVTAGEVTDDLPIPRRGRSELVGVTSDGLVVSTPMPTPMSLIPGGVSEGERRPYVLSNAQGDSVAVLAGAPEPPPPGVELFDNRGDPIGAHMLGPLCAPVSAHLVEGRRILIADARRGMLSSLTPDGRLVDLYTTSHRDTVRADYLDLLRRSVMNNDRASDASRQDVLERFGDVGAPFPNVWSNMIRDVQGTVWLERASCYPNWLDWEYSVWEALDDDWSLVAEVRVPTDLTVLSVSGDRVLALSFDELSVPYLGVYPVQALDGAPNQASGARADERARHPTS